MDHDFLADYVSHHLPGVTMARPEGTYLAWLDCRATGITDPWTFFLEQAKVALHDGRQFSAAGGGFVRLSFGTPRSILAEGLERMRRALARR
jgi:cystathionine beta-lyase